MMLKNQVKEELQSNGSQIVANCEVDLVSASENGK